MAETYRLVRFYQRDPQDLTREVLAEGQTFDQVREHCNDPETASVTCTTDEGRERTRKCGPWFEGFERETPTPVGAFPWPAPRQTDQAHGVSYGQQALDLD
jgi:hypothetical protein